MKVNQYIKEFNLNGAKVDQKGFMKAFGEEFIQKLNEDRKTFEDNNRVFDYNMFSNLVRQYEIKFWSISNKRRGKAFSEKLFGYFYANYVIPARKELFPEKHKQIEDSRLKKQLDKAQEKME